MICRVLEAIPTVCSVYKIQQYGAMSFALRQSSSLSSLLSLLLLLLSSLVQNLMNDIDIKPLHPKHKLLLYSRYVLSKLSWHFTIANISKTWITKHLDSVVNGYIRKWLDIPISGTLSNVFLERDKFGLNICLPSIKFTQCQTVLRNSLKESPNDSLKDLWKSSSCHTNIQYDVYKSNKEVLKDFRSNQEDKLQHHPSSTHCHL